MALLRIVVSAQEKTWQGLKEIMYQCVDPLPNSAYLSRAPVFLTACSGGVRSCHRNLLAAAEKLKWPLRVSYPSASADDRRAFERAFQDLLYLQSE
jgi:hypothetical protein